MGDGELKMEGLAGDRREPAGRHARESNPDRERAWGSSSSGRCHPHATVRPPSRSLREDIRQWTGASRRRGDMAAPHVVYARMGEQRSRR